MSLPLVLADALTTPSGVDAAAVRTLLVELVFRRGLAHSETLLLGPWEQEGESSHTRRDLLRGWGVAYVWGPVLEDGEVRYHGRVEDPPGAERWPEQGFPTLEEAQRAVDLLVLEDGWHLVDGP